MERRYVIYTSIDRGFNPDVAGVTLDSIAESCDGHVQHSIPMHRDQTEMHLVLNQPLDEEYVRRQLEAEFEVMGDDTPVVLDISEE
jgi:hypothetical protein